jgi:hypothetical protein
VDQATFNSLWRGAQHPEVLAVMAEGVEATRASEAMQLATQGLTVDYDIVVPLWDPWTAMNIRWQAGFKWIPSALQPNIQVEPGVPPLWGLQPYDPNSPPAGSIPVPDMTNDAAVQAAYPPFVVPAPPPNPAPGVSAVGQSIGAGYYAVLSSAGLKDGDSYTADPRGTFVYHRRSTPFGYSQWFWALSFGPDPYAAS